VIRCDVGILAAAGRVAIGPWPDRRRLPCLKVRPLGSAGRPPCLTVGTATGVASAVFRRAMDDEHDLDAQLAARLAANVDASFEALVLAHQDRLFTIAFRTGGDRHDAEELVQDCFVRAYRALVGYPPARIRELRLRGWLTTILLNAGRNRARTRRVPTTELTFEPGAEPTADPLARRDDRDAWARRLAALTPAQRTAVVLRHVDGMSYAEIAEATGRPEGTVKAHVHRGLAALRTALLAAERAEREEITA
jgi:RNA polymerase sigma factor (sigma-70 family)